MATKPPLPIFENRDDAKRYLLAFRAVIGGAVLVVVAVIASIPFSGGALPILLAASGILLALAGQAIYLSLNARVWGRHYPNSPWDWRTARGFYEGTLRQTLARARTMARGR